MEEKQEQFLERIRKDFNEYKNSILEKSNKEEIFSLAYKITVIQNFADGIESFMGTENIELDEEIIEKALKYKGNLMDYFWEDFFSSNNIDLNDFFVEWINELPGIVEKSLDKMITLALETSLKL